ncbi:MAG: LamG-like jellyroll fold domain-containing protein [Bacteroidia bacterium]
MKKLYTLFIAGSFMLSNNVFAQCESSTSLLVDLQMENTNADSSAYNQPVLNYGSPTFTTDRHGNATGALNTTSGTIFLSNDQSGNFKCQFPFTFSTWIKSNALGARNPIFMNEDHGSAYSGVWINLLQTGEVIASIGNGGVPGSASRKSATTTTQLVAGTWYHIAVVFNSLSDIDIYVNGAPQTVTYSGAGDALYYYMVSGTAGKIGSGVNGSGTNAYFNGAIDDLRFWNVALVDIQVQALYNSHYDFISAETLSICNDNEFTNVYAPNEQCDYNWSNGATSSVNALYGGVLGEGEHIIYASVYDNNNILYTDSVIVTVSACTGVDDNTDLESLSVYPNPSSGTVTIKTATPGYFTLSTVLGEQLMNIQIQNKHTLNMEQFAPGIYFITELNSGKTLRLLME